tara:strand:+ start:1975 stop:2235 length:261 start_codon:yes stop_codon:yes gene_type:complete
MHTQCELKKLNETLDVRTVSWIPKDNAKKGNIIEIKGEDGDWEVTDVFSTVSETVAKRKLKDYGKQSKVRDTKHPSSYTTGMKGQI